MLGFLAGTIATTVGSSAKADTNEIVRNQLPTGAYDVEDLGNGWFTFRVNLPFGGSTKRYKFLYNHGHNGITLIHKGL
jgi:hypothetical protein